MRTSLSLISALVQLAAAIQPTARNPERNQQLRDLKWGQLNFLHTTDNHGWHGGHLQEPQYSADLGDYISFVSHMHRIADEKGVDLVVVDTGDRAEGNGLWDASNPKGKYTREFYHEVDVDVITNGNHELYHAATAQNEFLEMIPYYGGKYIASNVDINIAGEWQPLAKRTYNFTTKNLGLRITSFGFLFNFTEPADNIKVKEISAVIEEDWFQKTIKKQDVDLFLIIGHIDVDDLGLSQVLAAIRKIHPNIPVQILGGHMHLRKFKVYDNKCTALESGKYFETVGFLSIDGLVSKAKDASLSFFRRYIDANRVGYQHHTGTNEETFDTPQGLNMTAKLTKYRSDLGLDNLYGCAPQDYTLSKNAFGTPENWYTFLEKNVLPKKVVNEERRDIPRIIFINTGSQRFDVFKGPFTYDTSFLVSPFTSKFKFVKDIPWAYASRLKEYFESDPKQYSYPTLEAFQEEANHSPYKCPPSPIRAQAQNQHILTNSLSVAITPGYTTCDDFGEDGDDTIHSEIPWHPIPKVIEGKASFPEDWKVNPPKVVDVVFMDFIGKYVAEGLNKISGKDGYNASHFAPYMGKEYTMTKLLLDYVQEEWSHDCIKG